MRLNVWHRLGIVVSVLWFLGGGLYQRTRDTKAAADAMGSYYRLCTAANPNGDFAKCMDHATDAYKGTLAGWDNALFVAIAPVILGWLLAYVVVWTTRWVLAGRRNVTALPK
jgi:hypothetical protein